MALLLAWWQFASPGMLAWALGAALPIVIHLLSRRTQRQERWAAMTFLLAAVQKNALRARLEQWILLFIRTAILLLLALALADPHVVSPTRGLSGATRAPKHLMVVIDGSYSMDYRSGDKSRFEIAKSLARKLVTDAEEGDNYSLLLMTRPPRWIIAAPTTNREETLREIDALELSDGGADLQASLAEVERALSSGTLHDDDRFLTCRVCILSDLQQVTFGEVTSVQCRAQLARLELLCSLELVDVAPGEGDNWAVTRLQVAPTLVAAGQQTQIRADIQSFARDDRPHQTLEFLVDGALVGTQRIDIPAGNQTAVSLPYRFNSPGEHIVEARLPRDALPLDDRRWLSVPARAKIGALLVGGRPQDTRYAALALAPEKTAPTNHWQIIEGTESRLSDDLSQFDVIVLCNVARLQHTEVAALRRFVTRGGGLIVFLGDQVEIDNYNQLLLGDAPELLPARLIESAPSGEYSFDPLDYRHEIVEPFRGFPKAGLLTTPVWKYVRLATRPGSTTAIAFSNGDPAIVESHLGEGACFLVATAATPDAADRSDAAARPWTALPVWPSFPPLLHEMLRAAVAGRHAHRNLLVGDYLRGIMTELSADSTITLTGPRALIERVPIRNEAGEDTWRYGPAPHSGVYEARVGRAVQRYAANLDNSESDLTRISADRLPMQLRQLPDTAASNGQTSLTDNQSYFRWLLGAVFLLLVGEVCLARQFGRWRG